MNHFDNAGRERCHRCAKLVFYAQTQAKEAAANAQANGVFSSGLFRRELLLLPPEHRSDLDTPTVIPSQVPGQSRPKIFASVADATRQERQERQERYDRMMEQLAAEQRQRDKETGENFRVIFIALFLPLYLPYKDLPKDRDTRHPIGHFRSNRLPCSD